MSLPPPQVEPLIRGPVRSAQLVVEIVGPRSVPATQAADLLRPDWRGALGMPELWAMRPADTHWKPLMAAQFGSYDSIALAWDLITPNGELKEGPARHLIGLAERFANPLGRRAIPLTPPEELASVIRRLHNIRNSLDAGLSLLAMAPRPFPTHGLAQGMADLGLQERNGTFGWYGTDHPEPLFEVESLQSGATTDGFNLTLRLARCPDPSMALDGLFHVLDTFVRQGLMAFDEDRNPLTMGTRDALRSALRSGAAALESIGLKPGSWAAIKAFP